MTPFKVRGEKKWGKRKEPLSTKNFTMQRRVGKTLEMLFCRDQLFNRL
jgi:hypothetical protein